MLRLTCFTQYVGFDSSRSRVGLLGEGLYADRCTVLSLAFDQLALSELTGSASEHLCLSA